MASKLRSTKVVASPKSATHPAAALRRELKNEKRALQAVERFRTSAKGFRGVFSGHFPQKVEHVETLAFHLAQFEAQLPNTLEAVRLARYPGAGNRNPRRMALGLCENLSVLKTHLSKSIGALEALANGHKKKTAK
jgi:hypothetical protein